eukprot:1159806-Pelagomonas_calceolata.AAC.5
MGGLMLVLVTWCEPDLVWRREEPNLHILEVELDGRLLPEVYSNVVFKETGASNSVYMKVRQWLRHSSFVNMQPEKWFKRDWGQQQCVHEGEAEAETYVLHEHAT